MTRNLFALAAILLVCAVPAVAEETPATEKTTLEKVLDKHYEAIGGLEAWAGVSTARLAGTMRMPHGMEAPFTLVFQRPGRSRLEFTLQGMTGIQAVDGQSAWQIMPFMGKTEPERMPAEQAKLMIEQADFDGPLVNWKEDGNKLEYVGTEDVQGTEAHKIKVTLATGDVRFYSLDAEHFLPIRSTGKATLQGQEVSFETSYGDYKEVGGLVMPFWVESRLVGAEGGQVFALEAAELDVELVGDPFSMPGSGG